MTKFSPGGAVLYSTYLGGPCEDYGRAIAVDGAGNAYVTGELNGGGLCTSTPGVLVAKLDPNGNLVYASRLGGSLVDSSYGTGIAVDPEGHAYVTGVALTSDFPTTQGAFRTAACPNVYPFAGDGFVAKLSVDGSALVYSTLLCGQGDDSPAGIAIDAAGNAYVAGTTASSDFPLVDPIELARGGGVIGISGFVSKLSPDGSQLLYSTYLGGSGSAVINAIALDAAGSAYVTGETDSTDFPTTPGVIQEKAGRRHCIYGCTDAFVTKIAPSGSALVYSTYLYGELDDRGNAIGVDGAGNAYVVGQTNSLLFPVLDAFQSSKRDLDDAFVVKLNPDATRLVYSSYLGGSRFDRSPGNGYDTGTAIVLDAAGNAYVAGYTQSKDLPTTPDAFQPNLAFGTCDVSGHRVRRRLRREDQRGRPRRDARRQPHRRHGRRRAGRDADRHLGRQPDAHGERLPPPVHARLRGRRVRRPVHLLADAGCRRRPAAAPAARRPSGRLVRAPAAEPGPELGPSGPDRPERADPDRWLDPAPAHHRRLRRARPATTGPRRPATTAIRAPIDACVRVVGASRRRRRGSPA